jgi:transcriptional regulator with XRE-family HTH domain
VWRDVVVQESLGELDFGRLSKRLREIVPLRQDDLAHLVGLTQGYLSRLEAGKVRLTHIDRIIEFLDAVGTPAGLVGIPLRYVGATTTKSPRRSPGSRSEQGEAAAPWTTDRMVAALYDATRGESDAMRPNRRQLLLTGIALTAYIHQWGIEEAEPLHRALSGARVTPELVESLQGTIDHLRTMDASSGGAPVAGLARAHLRIVHEALKSGNYNEETGRRLAGIAADTAAQLGWSYFDAGYQDLAQGALLAALRAAKASGDPRFGAAALSFLAIQSYSVGDPRDAVTAMQSARKEIRSLPTLHLEAMLLTRQARGHAKLGEDNLARSALGRAADLAGHDPAELDPHWLYWMNDGEILGQTASCYLDLGEHKAAASYFARAASAANPREVRTQALFASRAATAHLLAGDRDGGFEAADTALRLAGSVHSARLADHLATTAGYFQRTHDPRSKDLTERTRQVIATAESQQ